MKLQERLDVAKHGAVLHRRNDRHAAVAVGGRHGRPHIYVDKLAQPSDVRRSVDTISAMMRNRLTESSLLHRAVLNRVGSLDAPSEIELAAVLATYSPPESRDLVDGLLDSARCMLAVRDRGSPSRGARACSC